MNLTRLEYFEDGLVKFALGNDQDVLATLVYSTKFNDEMEIRVSQGKDRFSIRGHKSIMDNFSFEEFKRMVEKHLRLRNLLN